MKFDTRKRFYLEEKNGYFHLEAEEYKAIQSKVFVIKLTYDNLEDVARWCGGYVANTGGHEYVAFPEDGNDVLTVHPDQYLVKNEDGTFSRYLEEDLLAKYQRVVIHDSVCATNSEPAYPAGNCNCSISCKHDGFKQYNIETRESWCVLCGMQIYKQENGEYKCLSQLQKP